MISQTASRTNSTAAQERLYVAFELGWKSWKLAFCSRMNDKPFLATFEARDVAALKKAIEKARTRFGVSPDAEVISCYEAGRDGFWIARLLEQMGVRNIVVDSSSIEVNRRAKRAKTDRLDAEKLVIMLIRHTCGEPRVWSVVRVPTVAEEDARHVQRQIRTLKKEQTRSRNRIVGLLASQGVKAKTGREGLLQALEHLKIWDGSLLLDGIRLRIQSEMARYALDHEQLLLLETMRNQRIRRGASQACQKSRRIMKLRAIGPATAETLVREVFYKDFKNGRQVGSYVGLTPSVYQSGDMSHDTGISHAGNRHARGIAIDIGWMWLRLQPDSRLSRWYQQRFGSGGPRMRKIGIVALARKLVIALWRYAEFNELPEGALLKAA